MVSGTRSQSVALLIRRLDAAAELQEVGQVCAAVKHVLSDEIGEGRLKLPKRYVAVSEDSYARRLLHHDPDDRYTVVVMVWGSGQGTSIHDHAGKWCVECVYQGRVRVESYDLIGDPGDELVRFERADDITAQIGEAGALIPPFDYHVIRNDEEQTAITVHVYGGEMEGCHRFLPTDAGMYEREWRELDYTP